MKMRKGAWPLVLVTILVLGALGCSPKGRAVVIIDASGSSKVKGQTWVTFNPNGGYEMDIWAPSNLVLVRTSQTLSNGFSAKGGAIYRVGRDRVLQEVGSFDTTLTDEKLFARHLSSGK
jgi:hypothetical protein